MSYLVTFEGRSDEGADALERHLDAVMETLFDMGAEDPDIGAALTQGSFEITLRVEADRVEDAVADAAKIVRKALRAAGAEPIRFPQARATEDPSSALAPA